MLSSRLSALTLFLFSFLLILVFLPETTTANELTAPLAHKRMLKRHGPAPATLRSKRANAAGGGLLPLTDNGSDTDTDPAANPPAQNVGNDPPAGGTATATGTATASNTDAANPSGTTTPTQGGTTGNGNTGTTTGNGNTGGNGNGATTGDGNTGDNGDDGGNTGGILPGVGGLLGGNGGSSSTATATGSTTLPSTTTTPTSTSTPSSSSIPAATEVEITSTNTVFTATQPTADPARVSQEATQTRLSHQTIIILIVIASCVGGAGLIWTIIRKWKFRPSRRFDNRLDPIEWQPAGPNAMTDDGEMIERHVRNGSVNSQTDTSSIRRNLYAPDNNSQSLAPDFPPAHDFTAVPTAGGPMYGRGPSPQPYGRSGMAGGGHYGGGYEFSRGY